MSTSLPGLSPAPEVVVVGAGLIGLSCAHTLRQRGFRVLVVEAGEPARQASWASAGMLAPLGEAPLASTFFEVCRHSRDLWQSFAAELQDAAQGDLDYDTSGALSLPEEPAHLQALEAAARAVGEPCERIGVAEARRLLPGLADHHRELLHLPGEHRIDNRAACAALIAILERAGVPLRRGLPLTAIEPRRGGVVLRHAGGSFEAGMAVLAAGAWSAQIAGLPALPVLPVHGQMLALGNVDWPFAGSIRGETYYAVRRAGNRLLVGATAEEVGFADHPTLHGVAALSGWVQQNFPTLASLPLLELWSGLRPATPDRLPVLGALAENVLVATAHFRNGVLLAPFSAGVIADLAEGKEAASELDRRALELFAPARFDSGG